MWWENLTDLTGKSDCCLHFTAEIPVSVWVNLHSPPVPACTQCPAQPLRGDMALGSLGAFSVAF